MTNSEWEKRLGALIKRYRGPMSQETLANLVSDRSGEKVAQWRVSAHENGERWKNSVHLIKYYGEALGIPVRELYEAIDLPLIEDGPKPKTFAEIVAGDKTLSKAAKEHLLNQYELLQMASDYERAGKPVLHRERDEDHAPRRKRA